MERTTYTRLRDLAEQKLPPPVFRTLQKLNKRLRLDQGGYLGSKLPETTIVNIGETPYFFNIPTERQALRLADLVGEEEYLQRMVGSIKESDVVMDVGAAIGTHSIPAALAVWPGGEVYAFEPDPDYAEQVRMNAEMNSLFNVRVLPLALGEEEAKAKLKTSGLSGHAPTLDEYNNGQVHYEDEVEVDVVPLDSLVKEGVVRTPNVIKIDVEGGELGVLTGMKQVLNGPHLRDIFIEVHPNHGVKLKEVRSILEKAGFQIRWQQQRGSEILAHFQRANQVADN